MDRLADLVEVRKLPERAEGTVIRQNSSPATMDVTFVTIGTSAMERTRIWHVFCHDLGSSNWPQSSDWGSGVGSKKGSPSFQDGKGNEGAA